MAPFYDKGREKEFVAYFSSINLEEETICHVIFQSPSEI